MRCYSLEKKLTAVEACNYGLVTEVIPQAEFEKEINNRMKYMAALPPKVAQIWTLPLLLRFI